MTKAIETLISYLYFAIGHEFNSHAFFARNAVEFEAIKEANIIDSPLPDQSFNILYL